MKRSKMAMAAVSLSVLLGLSGCGVTVPGSTVGKNTELFFKNAGHVWELLTASDKEVGAQEGQKETKPASANENAKRLATPTNFTVDKDGNYQFTGVENAEYYLLYFCDPSAVNDEDTFIYSSKPISAVEGNTYAGNCANEFQYAFGKYLVKVFAFPKLTDTEFKMSSAATSEFEYKGNQSAPQIGYYWNTFEGTMGVQVMNLGTYEFEAYPEKVEVTFTNTAKADDVVTVEIANVSKMHNNVFTDKLTRGETYEVTAKAENGSEFVLNPVSEETQVGTLTLGVNHLYTGVTYTDGFANNIFNWPIVQEGFNLKEGGIAGQTAGWRGPTNFMVKPVEAREGSKYSYDLEIGFMMPLTGTLELKEDGTFKINETGAGPVNAASIEGTWVESGDGTATLNYDHRTVVID